jgi:hypothetical protein
MRFVPLLLLSCVVASAQNIGTKPLIVGAPIRIALNPALTTTLLFPAPLSGVFGLGLVSDQSTTGGTVQISHPDGSNVLVLHALSATAHVLATVLLNGALYVLDLETSAQPDIAITFVTAEQAAPRAVPVTPEEIVSVRPKYDPEILISLLRRARDSGILQPLYRDLYEGYTKKEVFFTSDSGSVKTTVTTVHRFSKEDAVVLQGVVENETDHPVTFDGRAATVLVANEVHPIKLLDCLRPIPAHTRTLIDCVIQGDIDGGRANLSVENSYRIELPSDSGNVWQFKNGSSPGQPFKIPSPLRPSPPLTQTSDKKESN